MIVNTILSIALLIAVLLSPPPDYTTRPQQGTVKYYAPGVMQRVLANRLRWRQVQPCAECIGLVALMRCDDLDRRIWLQRPGRDPEGPYHVIDCAARQHLARRLAQGDVAEVSWEIARRWRMSGPLHGVLVLFEPPAQPQELIRRREDERTSDPVQW